MHLKQLSIAAASDLCLWLAESLAQRSSENLGTSSSNSCSIVWENCLGSTDFCKLLVVFLSHQLHAGQQRCIANCILTHWSERNRAAHVQHVKVSNTHAWIRKLTTLIIFQMPCWVCSTASTYIYRHIGIHGVIIRRQTLFAFCLPSGHAANIKTSQQFLTHYLAVT